MMVDNALVSTLLAAGGAAMAYLILATLILDKIKPQDHPKLRAVLVFLVVFVLSGIAVFVTIVQWAPNHARCKRYARQIRNSEWGQISALNSTWHSAIELSEPGEYEIESHKDSAAISVGGNAHSLTDHKATSSMPLEKAGVGVLICKVTEVGSNPRIFPVRSPTFLATKAPATITFLINDGDWPESPNTVPGSDGYKDNSGYMWVRVVPAPPAELQ